MILSMDPKHWAMKQKHDRVPVARAIDGVRHRLDIGVPGQQHNPTVLVHGGQLCANVRVLNGTRTTNYFGPLHDWDMRLPRRLSPPVGEEMRPRQVEDLRLVSRKGRIEGIAAVHGDSEIIRQATFVLEGPRIAKLRVWKAARHEKNWMPAVDGDRLRLVYSVDPLLVIDEDECGDFATPIRAAGGVVRGGSQLIPYRGGWLAIVHQVYKPPAQSGHNGLLGGWAPVRTDPQTVYLHQFAFFDQEMEDVFLSSLFHFNAIGVEFCAGLCSWGGKLVASYGVADQEAWLIEIDPNTVERLFA